MDIYNNTDYSTDLNSWYEKSLVEIYVSLIISVMIVNHVTFSISQKDPSYSKTGKQYFCWTNGRRRERFMCSKLTVILSNTARNDFLQRQNEYGWDALISGIGQ